ncbi:hypothetical protein D1646_04060 [Pseudoflavonifractor sp. 60]|uniref:hypothetical protein n=1 Tax=Pseudoflavonifractor sp. 60 TaxID=2304576 RepID=UPI00136851AC|nr:hypothetical protein [Pseudoflavonifractor sp. 60]NBI65998.1 hypothetical protein [Pseudoflavonifractor sp. 60]
MDLFESEVIFSKSFPKLNVDELGDVELKGYEADLELKKVDASSFLENFNKKFVYIPRPDAEQRAKEFISYAIELCNDFEIDTEISRTEYSIDVSMNIGFGWFGGHIKRELDKLIGMADDVSTFTRKDDSDALIIVASYYTHDRY